MERMRWDEGVRQREWKRGNTSVCHSSNHIVAILYAERERCDRVPEPGAVHFVDFGDAEEHWGAAD